jgi:hypothetical protein
MDDKKLYRAIKNDRLDVIEKLLDAEPKPFPPESGAWLAEALARASAAINFDSSRAPEGLRVLAMFRLMLRKGVSANLRAGTGFGPPLHLAAQLATTEAAAALLEAGADVNRVEPRFAAVAPPGTPLALATTPEMRALLKKWGAR